MGGEGREGGETGRPLKSPGWGWPKDRPRLSLQPLVRRGVWRTDPVPSGSYGGLVDDPTPPKHPPKIQPVPGQRVDTCVHLSLSRHLDSRDLRPVSDLRPTRPGPDPPSKLCRAHLGPVKTFLRSPRYRPWTTQLKGTVETFHPAPQGP